MMRLFRRGVAAGALGLVAIAAGCKTDLTAPNLNNPDLKKVLSSGPDVQNVIGNAFATWWNGEQNVNMHAMAVNADAITSSFGNFGMRFNGQEPRIAYGNIAGGSDRGVAEGPWAAYYGALGSANDGLKAVNAGVVISNAATTDQYVTFAKFIQAVSYSSLAMYYDQAFVVNEKSDPTTIVLQPYAQVRDSALARFDEVISRLAGKSYTYPQPYIEDLRSSASDLAKIANSLAARTIVLSSRTGTQNTAANWAKVLAYASKGVSSGTPFNLEVSVTSTNSFGNNFTAYAETSSWTRVDMRVIQAMDSTQPQRFTTTSAPPKATSADARLTSDYLYNSSIPFAEARGVWFFSSWSHKRYLYMARGQPLAFLGITPNLIAAENDLMWAEALVRTNGDKALAATLINKTRVTRGQLSPATAAMTSAQLLSLIRYERLVDLYGTSVFTSWGDARRDETLYAEGPRSVPVPAAELQTLGLPVYTFGGPGIPDGR